MLKRQIAVVIPHLGLYGGNLRYIEIGNALVDRGVDFTIATPEATRPDYLEFRGRVATLDELRQDPPEVLLASEQRIFPEFLAFPAQRRYFYWIIPKTERDAEIAEACRRGRVGALANSAGMVDWLRRKHGVKAAPVVGGVNLELFHPLADGEAERKPPGRFRVLANGRFSRRRKGSHIVTKAVHQLARRHPDLELVFFDSSTVDHRAGLPADLRCRARVRLDLDVPRTELRRVYGSADVFVSAEKNAGWSNQTIEAMACGVPVICTKAGTQDFAIPDETALVTRRAVWHVKRALKRMIADETLRSRLAAAGLAKARTFPWSVTVAQLLRAVEVSAPIQPSARIPDSASSRTSP
jgi:glycosyltransferase involved in cell wall biosynthesis